MSKAGNVAGIQVNHDRVWSGCHEVVDNGKADNYRGLVRRNKLALCEAEAAAMRVQRLCGIRVGMSEYMLRALDTLTEESGRWAAAA